MIGKTNAGGGGKVEVKLQTKTINASGTYTPDEGYDGFGEVTASFDESEELTNLRNMIDGTITSFTMPSGKTTINSYMFYQQNNLVSVDLGETTKVGECAFYCCKHINDISFPSTLTLISEYAFYGICSFVSYPPSLTFSPSSACYIGPSAFANSSGVLKKITGNIGEIGHGAFLNNYKLEEVNVTSMGSLRYEAFRLCGALSIFHAPIKGGIERNAFERCTNMTDIDISNAVITSIGKYSFDGIGAERDEPENNILTLDFRNSSFTSIPQYAFASSSTSWYNKYIEYRLPPTVTTIEDSAFQYNQNIWIIFSGETPLTLRSSQFQNASDYTIFVPYQCINSYRMASELSSSSDIKGYASSGTFKNSDSLPTINNEGYGLTWYSDKGCTNEIKTVDDPDTELYCLAGEEVLAYIIANVTNINCEVIISDRTKTYTSGQLVLVDTLLYITLIPKDDNYVPFIFEVNGEEFTSGNTITVNSVITIKAICWQENDVHLDTTFENNSWDIISQAFKIGVAADYWSLGDTKELTLSDGTTYNIRIVDMTKGRYTDSDGVGTNGVLEFVELVKIDGTSDFKMHSDVGGCWANCVMHTQTMENIYTYLPEDVQSVIREIVLSEYSYTSPSPRESQNKLFLPAESELFAQRSYSAEGKVTPLLKQFGYYANDPTSAILKKYIVGTTTSSYYWTRSPQYNSNSYWCRVNYTTAGYDVYYSTRKIAPIFAL